MSRMQYLSEADRYDRLAREAHNQVVATQLPEYYEIMARTMRALAQER